LAVVVLPTAGVPVMSITRFMLSKNINPIIYTYKQLRYGRKWLN
jgi:hypothetical protein